jgi:pimeloyl-ACP methyl ester carboxylesterase
MRRGWKIALAILAGIVVLLVLNAITVSNETQDAERNIEGAELIETSNGTLQILDEGNPKGSPIVLIHGYSGSMHWFDRLAPLLVDDHRVIRLDLLGHGGSDKPSAGYEISDQADAIAEALASLEVTDATVLGHSLGAAVATALAEQSPELATRVVNVDQAPDDSYEDLGFTAELGYKPLIGQAMKRGLSITPDSVITDQFKQAFAPDFSIASGFEDPDQPAADLKEMTYTAFVDVSDAEGDYSSDRSLDDRLAGIGVPVLVVFGAEDQIYDPAEEAIAPYAEIPGARTELIEDVGHSPNVESPEDLAALIREFIEANATPAKKAPKKKASPKGKKGAGEAPPKPAAKPAPAKKAP